ncbi:MAG: alanine racemase [Salinivenus sp.]
MPVTATVDLGAIRHNVRVLRQRAGEADLMAVVKADAYGHGLVPVARTLAAEGVRHFAVARPAEGVRLRDAGLSGRILVLGAPFSHHLSVYTHHDLDVTVSSVDIAEAVCEHGTASRPLRAHVKADTGMGRIGLPLAEVPPVVRRLTAADGVILAGLWTHFATADEPGSAFAQTQLDRFESLLDRLDVTAEHIHAANTGALLTIGARARAFSRPLVRTGLSLYGLAARPELAVRLDLRPAMRLRARVTHLKTVAPGTPISYGAEWTAPERTCIATLGVGYGDGYPRLGSGRAVVRFGDEQRPVVGTICMDMCMVNLGPPDRPPATTVSVGDEALLFGPEGPTLYDVAEWAKTIPYEICCGLSSRVPRTYVEEGADSLSTASSFSPSTS